MRRPHGGIRRGLLARATCGQRGGIPRWLRVRDTSRAHGRLPRRLGGWLTRGLPRRIARRLTRGKLRGPVRRIPRRRHGRHGRRLRSRGRSHRGGLRGGGRRRLGAMARDKPHQQIQQTQQNADAHRYHHVQATLDTERGGPRLRRSRPRSTKTHTSEHSLRNPQIPCLTPLDTGTNSLPAPHKPGNRSAIQIRSSMGFRVWEAGSGDLVSWHRCI